MNLNDLQNLMDDLARHKGPSHSDLESREDDLRAALDAHPEWMNQMRTRDEFDVKLCKVMPQVDIPEGLKERLLTALDTPQVPVEPAPAAERQRRSRRRFLTTATVLATAVLVSFAIWMIPRTPNLTVADVERELPKLWDAALNTLPDADPDQAVLPSGGWNSRRLVFAHSWKTHDVSGESLALRRLEFNDRGRVHTGLLASLPLSSFATANQPHSADPFYGEIHYLKTDSGSMLAIVTWKDPQTKRVYFLAVPAEDHTLKALEELLDIPLA